MLQVVRMSNAQRVHKNNTVSHVQFACAAEGHVVAKRERKCIGAVFVSISMLEIMICKLASRLTKGERSP